MKKLLAILLALTLVFAISACGNTAKTEDKPVEEAATPAEEASVSTDDTPQDGPNLEGGPIVVGMVLKTLSSEYWQYVASGAKAAAADLGIDLRLVGPNAESEIMEQVSMIDDLVSQNVDAITVAPNEVNAAITALTPAVEADIPVIFVDTDADLPGKVAFVGTGNESAAKLGADYIGTVVEKGTGAVIIRGRLGDLTHDQRADGYKAGLEAAGIEVLEIQPADSASDKAVAVMEDFIQRFDNISAVLCTNDEMAIGAYQAVKQAGLTDVKIIGFDGNVSAIEMTLAGELEGSVAQQPYQMGYMAVENAVKAAKKEHVEPVIDTGAQVITAANGKTYLAGLKEMLEK